jgi:hypothetical protein
MNRYLKKARHARESLHPSRSDMDPRFRGGDA